MILVIAAMIKLKIKSVRDIIKINILSSNKFKTIHISKKIIIIDEWNMLKDETIDFIVTNLRKPQKNLNVIILCFVVFWCSSTIGLFI